MKKQRVSSAISKIDSKCLQRSLHSDTQKDVNLSRSLHSDLEETQIASVIIKHLQKEIDEIAELLKRFAL